MCFDNPENIKNWINILNLKLTILEFSNPHLSGANSKIIWCLLEGSVLKIFNFTVESAESDAISTVAMVGALATV